MNAPQSHPVLLGRKGRYLAQIAIVFVAQFCASKIADVIPTVNSGWIGPVWPASGIALGALLLCGDSVWPGIAAGAFLHALLGPLPLWADIVYAAGTTLAVFIGASLLRRVNFSSSLSRLGDVIGLIVFGGIGSAIVSASIGASTFYAAHVRGWSGFGAAWLVYWLGDSTGVLLVTPLVLTFPTFFRIRSRNRLTELATVLLLLTLTCFIIFGDLDLLPVRVHILAFAVLPFVMWVAIRFGVSAAALSVLLVATIATIETALGSGPFAKGTALSNAVFLDLFFAVLSITGLSLAATIAEREQSERDRERLVKERAEAEARLCYAAIVESSEDAIISGDLNGIILTWNAGARRIYGYTEAEAVGKSVTILVPPELPDEENKILGTLRVGCRIDHFETVRITKTGKRINVSLTISPIKDSSGRTIGISGIARDITERKRAEALLHESEERFRLVANTAPVMIWMSGLDKKPSYFNQLWLDFTGLSEATLQNGLAGIVHPEDYQQYHEIYCRGFDERQPFRNECRLRRHDGQYRWILDIGVPRFQKDGSFAGYIGSCVDVTDHKLAVEALSGVARKLVDAQEQERARIARELHDDITQRLAMLAVELEQVQDNPSEMRGRLQELREEAGKISHDVQALSHDLHSSQLEYLGAVRGMKSWCREYGGREGVQIDYNPDVRSALPPEIGLCLFRVLQEALHNAVKHSGVKRVEVQLHEGPDEIHLTVRDLGRGFDVDAVKLGKGLGLISMLERVRLVNGTISIESKPMAGTTIHVRVPFVSKHSSQREVG